MLCAVFTKINGVGDKNIYKYGKMAIGMAIDMGTTARDPQ